MTWTNLRLFIVDNKADEVPVVGGPIALPGQFDPRTAGAVGLELQDSAFTWKDRNEETRAESQQSHSLIIIVIIILKNALQIVLLTG